LVRLLENLGGLLLGLTQGVGHLVLSQFQILLRTAGCIQTFSDLLLTCTHGGRYRRPDELHAERDEESEGERSTEQRQVNVHSGLPRAISCNAGVTSTATGFARRTPSQAGECLAGDNEDEVHRDTNTDHRDGV